MKFLIIFLVLISLVYISNADNPNKPVDLSNDSKNQLKAALAMSQANLDKVEKLQARILQAASKLHDTLVQEEKFKEQNKYLQHRLEQKQQERSQQLVKERHELIKVKREAHLNDVNDKVAAEKLHLNALEGNLNQIVHHDSEKDKQELDELKQTNQLLAKSLPPILQ